MTYTLLLRSLFYETDDALYTTVSTYLKCGQDPNAVSQYAESSLKQASKRQRMDAVSFLLENGADLDQLKWTPLHHAVALGTLNDVKRALRKNDTSARDYAGHTPFLLSRRLGEHDKAAALLDATDMADRYAVGGHKPALLVVAVEFNVNDVGSKLVFALWDQCLHKCCK